MTLPFTLSQKGLQYFLLKLRLEAEGYQQLEKKLDSGLGIVSCTSLSQGRKAKVSMSKRTKSKSDQEPAVVARLRSYKPSFLLAPYSRVCLEMPG